VTDGASVERWHFGIVRGAVGCHPLFEFVERVAWRLVFADRAVFAHGEVFSRSGESRVGAEAEERVAAGLVVLFGGFEQEGRFLRAEFGKCGDRGFGIGDDVAVDRGDAAGLRP